MTVMTRLAISLSVLVALLNSCSSGISFTSVWPEKEVNIDGVSTEWIGSWQIPKDSDLIIAAKNDAENVYFALTTRDLGLIRMVSMFGFTLWIDSNGGRSEDYGLEFQGWRSQYPPGTMRRGSAGQEQIQSELAAALTGRMPLAPVKKALNVTDGSPGTAAGRYADGEWFCEFRINRSALGLTSDETPTIGVGIVTSLPEVSPTRSPGGGERPGGGMSGGRSGGALGGSPGGMGGRPGSPGGGMSKMMDPVELWAQVELTTPK